MNTTICTKVTGYSTEELIPYLNKFGTCINFLREYDRKKNDKPIFLGKVVFLYEMVPKGGDSAHQTDGCWVLNANELVDPSREQAHYRVVMVGDIVERLKEERLKVGDLVAFLKPIFFYSTDIPSLTVGPNNAVAWIIHSGQAYHFRKKPNRFAERVCSDDRRDEINFSDDTDVDPDYFPSLDLVSNPYQTETEQESEVSNDVPEKNPFQSKKKREAARNHDSDTSDEGSLVMKRRKIFKSRPAAVLREANPGPSGAKRKDGRNSTSEAAHEFGKWRSLFSSAKGENSFFENVKHPANNMVSQNTAVVGSQERGDVILSIRERSLPAVEDGVYSKKERCFCKPIHSCSLRQRSCCPIRESSCCQVQETTCCQVRESSCCQVRESSCCQVRESSGCHCHCSRRLPGSWRGCGCSRSCCEVRRAARCCIPHSCVAATRCLSGHCAPASGHCLRPGCTRRAPPQTSTPRHPVDRTTEWVHQVTQEPPPLPPNTQLESDTEATYRSPSPLSFTYKRRYSPPKKVPPMEPLWGTTDPPQAEGSGSSQYNLAPSLTNKKNQNENCSRKKKRKLFFSNPNASDVFIETSIAGSSGIHRINDINMSNVKTTGPLQCVAPQGSASTLDRASDPDLNRASNSAPTAILDPARARDTDPIVTHGPATSNNDQPDAVILEPESEEPPRQEVSRNLPTTPLVIPSSGEQVVSSEEKSMIGQSESQERDHCSATSKFMEMCSKTSSPQKYMSDASKEPFENIDKGGMESETLENSSRNEKVEEVRGTDQEEKKARPSSSSEETFPELRIDSDSLVGETTHVSSEGQATAQEDGFAKGNEAEEVVVEVEENPEVGTKASPKKLSLSSHTRRGSPQEEDAEEDMEITVCPPEKQESDKEGNEEEDGDEDMELTCGRKLMKRRRHRCRPHSGQSAGSETEVRVCSPKKRKSDKEDRDEDVEVSCERKLMSVSSDKSVETVDLEGEVAYFSPEPPSVVSSGGTFVDAPETWTLRPADPEVWGQGLSQVLPAKKSYDLNVLIPSQTLQVVGVIINILPSISESPYGVLRGSCQEGCRSNLPFSQFCETEEIRESCPACRHRLHKTCPRCDANGVIRKLCIFFSFELHLLDDEQVLRVEVEHQEAITFLGCTPGVYLKSERSARKLCRRLESLVVPRPPASWQDCVLLNARLRTVRRSTATVLVLQDTRLSSSLTHRGRPHKF